MASGGGFAWEDSGHQSWATLCEDDQGRLLDATRAGQLRRRRRQDESAGAVRRGMIRYLYVVLDLSKAMAERDQVLRPNRAAASVSLLQQFIPEFFEENPISNVGVLATRHGAAEKWTDLSGNPRAHVEALRDKLATGGEASLQLVLEMACTLMKNIPDYGNREVLVVYGSLVSCDPGDIFATIEKLKKHRIRVSVIGLAAQVHIIQRIVEETGGTSAVVLHQEHFKQLLNHHLTPPPATTSRAAMRADFVQMGFPKRVVSSAVLACDRGKMSYVTTGFECPRCLTAVGELPATCSICNLQLVSSPLLAQSYHHLFLLPRFDERSGPSSSAECFGCGVALGGDPTAPVSASTPVSAPTTPPSSAVPDDERRVASAAVQDAKQLAATSFECPDCGKAFCMECDFFLHEVLHNCPGCVGPAGGGGGPGI